MSEDRRKIPHVLIVSGPSASGKSTLIDQLAKGGLEAPIARLMPSGSAEWVYLSGNDILKRQLRIEDVLAEVGDPAGVIVDYDFVHIIRVGYSNSYSNDPIFKILDYCDRITVVDIRPSRERLFHQFSTRLAEQRRRKGEFRWTWRRLIHAPLKNLRLRLKKEHHLDKEELYQDASWLQACYAGWDRFLEQIQAAREDLTLVRIEPVQSEEGDAGFRELPVSRGACPRGEQQAGPD